MPLEIQMKLRESPMYKTYLRSNSAWYKKLIRDPNLFKEFLSEMKTNYQLRPIDKLSKTIDALGVISNLFNNML
jgi:hypothetical protein